jgi:hypothetical protein
MSLEPALRPTLPAWTRARRARALAASAAALATVAFGGAARADAWAAPPGDDDPPRRRGVAVVDQDDDRTPSPEPKPSVVRFYAGPAGKVDKAAASPGMMLAVDLGRGPAGFRLSSAWLDVGKDRGVSQYTGELTIDFGGRSRFRPVVGAGGGVARSSSSVRDDGSVDTSTGATMGVGLVRAGLGFRLPFEETDARVALDVVGVLPAIRGATAPDLGPWALGAITVGVGF